MPTTTAPDLAPVKQAGPGAAAIDVIDVEKIFWEWKRSAFTAKPVRALRALAPVSFRVEPGEFVSIVGPSGCGKSTLLSLIAGLSQPSAGTIKVGERVVTGPGAKDTAMVFQNIGLLPWLTAAENVMFGLSRVGRRGGPSKDEARQSAVDALGLVGLEHFADSYPNQLSGGMQQRVAIARALVIKPTLLLMDEPFGALDAQTRTVLQEELLRLRAQWRGSIVFVTHDIDEAVFLSDRVIVMGTRPGHLAEVIDVPIDRPRDSITTRASEVYVEIRTRIWRTLLPMTESSGDGQGAITAAEKVWEEV